MYEASGSSYERGLEVPFCSREQMEHKLRSEGLWNDLTEKAINQAEKSHAGVTRDSGAPYMTEHVYPVAMDVLSDMLRREKPPDEVRDTVIAAILHDVVEDDPTIDIGNIMNDFGMNISRLVYPLTKYEPPVSPYVKERKRVKHEMYMSKLYSAHKNSQRIKIFDRMNNMRCSILLAESHPKKLQAYTIETDTEYLPLARTLLDDQLYGDLKALVNEGYAILSKQGAL